MSNGTPEPFEGGPQGAPPWFAIFALVYTVAWILAAVALVFSASRYLKEYEWIVWASIVLLAVSMFILAREVGFIGPYRGSRHS